MKKIILITIISIINIQAIANEYRTTIDNSSYKGSVSVENIPDPAPIICDSPNMLNESKTSCYNPFDNVSWILRDQDTCNGIRQSNFDPNIYYVRANTVNEKASLPIPNGFHWMSRNEYRTAFLDSTVENKNDSSIFVYKDQCGIISAPYLNGVWQGSLIFSDTGGVYYGHTEQSSGSNNTYNYGGGMLGYVLYKD